MYQATSAYHQHMMSSSSSPALPSMQPLLEPLSGESQRSTAAEAAAGPYPTLTPLRTRLSSPSMNGPLPDRTQSGRSARDGLRPSAAYRDARSLAGSSGGSVQRPSPYPSARQ